MSIANSLHWLFGYGPNDERGRALIDRYQLAKVPDEAHLRRALMATDEFRQALAERTLQPQNPPLRLDRPRLVFLHVPKCGGTTLHAILGRHFAEDEICPERFNGLRSYRLDELARYTLFSGHFDLESCHALFGRNTGIVTLLREPRARLISLYYFLKIHRPGAEPVTAEMVSLARSLPPEAFFAHPMVRQHASVRDAMTSLLVDPAAGVRWEAIDTQLAPDARVLADPHGAAELAKQRLDTLTSVGLLERFPESLTLMSAELGLTLEALPAQQVTDELRHEAHLDHSERPEMTPALSAILDELTQADRLLYAHAEALVADRIAALPGRAAVDFGPAPVLGSIRAIPLDALTPLEGRLEGARLVASGAEGAVALGPYMPVPHGDYRLAFHYAQGRRPDGSRRPITVHIWHQRGRAKCGSVTWTGESPCAADFRLAFDVADLEFVVVVEADSGFELFSMELVRIDGPGPGAPRVVPVADAARELVTAP